MAMPDIVVMMMTYNNESDVAQSLKSLAEQTYRNFHLVYVDDCSTDNTYHVAEAFRDRFDHVSMIRNSKNKGVIQNLYDTLRLIEDVAPQAEFFIWSCADDWMEPEFFEKTRQALLNNQDASVCQSWFDNVNIRDMHLSRHKLRSIRGGNYKESESIFRLYHSDVDPTYYNYVLHGLMRKSVLRHIYPDDMDQLHYNAGTELSGLVAMLLHGDILVLPEYLIHRRYYGRFSDNNPQDSLSQYYRNIGLRLCAVLTHLPIFLRVRPSNRSLLFVLFMWAHLFYFYGVLATYVRIREICRNALKRALTKPAKTA